MSIHWNERINSKAFKKMNDKKTLKDARLPIASVQGLCVKTHDHCQNKFEAH